LRQSPHYRSSCIIKVNALNMAKGMDKKKEVKKIKKEKPKK
jgi:hypothetical protein